MPVLEDEFCDVLGKAMRGKEYSTGAVAQKLAISPQLVEKWLENAELPAPGQVAQLAELLDLDARSLAESAHESFVPGISWPSEMRSYVQTPQPSNGYVVAHAGEGFVVDPAGDPDRIVAAAQALGVPLRYILITHRHADHCDAAEAVAARFPHAVIVVNAIEYQAAGFRSANELHQIGNAEFSFAGTTITSRLVAGHTDGLTIFRFQNFVFVGDALFAGSIGRCNGPLTSYEEQRAALHAEILSLAPETIILPGHGPATTVALERLHNPFLAKKYRGATN